MCGLVDNASDFRMIGHHLSIYICIYSYISCSKFSEKLAKWPLTKYLKIHRMHLEMVNSADTDQT